LKTTASKFVSSAPTSIDSDSGKTTYI